MERPGVGISRKGVSLECHPLGFAAASPGRHKTRSPEDAQQDSLFHFAPLKNAADKRRPILSGGLIRPQQTPWLFGFHVLPATPGKKNSLQAGTEGLRWSYERIRQPRRSLSLPIRGISQAGRPGDRIRQYGRRGGIPVEGPRHRRILYRGRIGSGGPTRYLPGFQASPPRPILKVKVFGLTLW